MKSTVEVSKYHTYTGHKDCLYTLERIDDRRFVSSGADGMIVLWDLADLSSGTMIAKVPSSCYALKYLPERDMLIVGQNFEGVHLIDITQKKEIATLKLSDAAIFDIQVWGNYAYVAMGDGELYCIDLEEMIILKRLAPSDKSARSIALTDEYVMVGFSDQFIRVFDRKNGLKVVNEFEAHDISVFTLVVDQERELLISGSRDAHLKGWRLGTWELEYDVVAHMYAINHVALSLDNRHFVTCSMDKSIKIWDAETFRLKKVIDKARHAGHATSVNKLLWMPFNNLLVSCSDDQSIAVWDIKIDDQ
jgi:WD40 repeat protein